MLKIKDDVDLKELEKFGFENVNNIWASRLYAYKPHVCSNVKRIIIDNKRVIHINCPTIKVYEVLYDLISAGLVEKRRIIMTTEQLSLLNDVFNFALNYFEEENEKSAIFKERDGEFIRYNYQDFEKDVQELAEELNALLKKGE